MKLHYKSTILGILLTVFLVSLFAGLGRWQLTRYWEKTEILETYNHHAKEPASALPSQLEDPAQWRYRKVYTTATPIAERQFLLDNQTHNGRVGFNVLTTFRLANGHLVLVDRGWVPLGSSRRDLPDISIPKTPMRIEGTIYTPYEKPFSLGGMDDGEIGWPRIIQFLDFKVLTSRLGEPLHPFTIRLDPTMEYGYLRDWKIIAISPNKHLAYVFQWFALALATIAIFLLLVIRRKNK